MKKLHFPSIAILFALFAMASFTACSSDDDETPSTEDIKTNIVGMWQSTHISGWDYDDTDEENLIKVDQDIPEADSYRMLFKGDGTCKEYYWDDYKWHLDGTYKYEVSGNKIIFYDSHGDIEGTANVLSIKGDVAIFELTLEEGAQYKHRTTFKRVY